MTSCAHHMLSFSRTKLNAIMHFASTAHRLLAAAEVIRLLVATVEHHEHEHIPLA